MKSVLYFLLAATFCTSGILFAQEEQQSGMPKAGENQLSGTQLTVPVKLSYQGLLTTSTGIPLADGSYDIEFSLWTADSLGSSVWSEVQTGVPVSNGTFSVALGSGSPLAGVNFNNQYYVQVSVTSGPAGPSYPLTFLPRSGLTSAPSSLAPWVPSGGSISYTDGYVGIGTTAPAQPLHVKRTNPFFPDARIRIQNDTNWWSGVVSNNSLYEYFTGLAGVFDGDPTMWQVYDNTADARRLLIKSDGRVAIGTSFPDTAARLTVANTSGAGRVFGTPLGDFWDLGILGTSTSAYGGGVVGYANGSGGNGVVGWADSGSIAWGVLGMVDSGSAVVGWNYGNYGLAGEFNGNVSVSGSLSKGSGSFKIDHPLDPENKYLYHSFVESPDMMNIYNGNITTNGTGEAVVTLPDYFEALNMDFRYQLTVIGDFAQAIISEKIAENRFSIRTDKPYIEVSWMVTGVRQDPYAVSHRIVPEMEKDPENRGKYIHPAERGVSESLREGNAKLNGMKDIRNRN